MPGTTIFHRVENVRVSQKKFDNFWVMRVDVTMLSDQGDEVRHEYKFFTKKKIPLHIGNDSPSQKIVPVEVIFNTLEAQTLSSYEQFGDDEMMELEELGDQPR